MNVERFESNKLSNILETFDVDIIFSVGFKNIFPESFCQKFEGKLLNIHPLCLDTQIRIGHLKAIYLRS